jgi:uncharacterized membrane protein
MNPGQTAHQAARSDTVKRLGRFGFASRAAVFVLLGVVTLLIAFAGRRAEPDQRGALAELAGHWYGLILLWIVFLGLVAFALWCFSQAAVGVVGKEDETLPRIQQFISGCVYGSLAVSAFTLAIHAHTSSQARTQSTFTGRVMSHSGGRWAVGIVGLVILGAGLVMAYDGLRRKFVEDLRTAEMDEATQRTVTTLGVVGAVARGLVFALSGFLFLDAAWTYDAKKATGLDGALRTLQQTAFGPYLLGLAALGLIAFGLYGFAEAKYRRT